MALPGIDVAWSQIVPGLGQTFVRYNLRRREVANPGPTQVLLYTTTDVAQITYEDRTVASHKDYEYSVTWVANITGEEFESADAWVSGDVEFEGLWLHRYEDPDTFLELRSNSFTPTRTADIAFRKTWGRTKPVAILNPQLSYEDLPLESIPFLLTDSTDIRILEAMQEGQPVSVLCLRLGGDTRVFFCVLVEISENREVGTYNYSLSLSEVGVDEDVT